MSSIALSQFDYGQEIMLNILCQQSDEETCFS